MKAIILAGGLGTRLSEETTVRPKPMVEIGGMPILWHIMKIYSAHGITEFVVCCGYKGYFIKEYFANYLRHNSDFTIDLQTGEMEVHGSSAEPWKVTCVDTGDASMTGGRLRRVRDHVGDGPFCFTYGDGVADVDIAASIAHHERHGKLATVTAVQPPGRFGSLEMDGAAVTGFTEKPAGDGGWINAGFFVLDPAVIDYIDGDDSIWEQAPMRGLAADGELCAYMHDGFWTPMDTVRDKQRLEELWSSGEAPWRIWE
jgi:glucose-1-phosphate cytidylyltransferase